MRKKRRRDGQLSVERTRKPQLAHKRDKNAPTCVIPLRSYLCTVRRDGRGARQKGATGARQTGGDKARRHHWGNGLGSWCRWTPWCSFGGPRGIGVTADLPARRLSVPRPRSRRTHPPPGADVEVVSDVFGRLGGAAAAGTASARPGLVPALRATHTRTRARQHVPRRALPYVVHAQPGGGRPPQHRCAACGPVPDAA
jgi:hypothetical protein